MNKLVLILLLSLTYACGQKSGDLHFFRPDKEQFNPYINQTQIEQSDLNLDTYFYTNEDYPIEISLYKDGSFFYNLPSLGKGTGNWVYENGLLKLINKRYFSILGRDVEMEYEIKALDESGKNLMIFFRDRFGLKSYPLTIKNL